MSETTTKTPSSEQVWRHVGAKEQRFCTHITHQERANYGSIARVCDKLAAYTQAVADESAPSRCEEHAPEKPLAPTILEDATPPYCDVHELYGRCHYCEANKEIAHFPIERPAHYVEGRKYEPIEVIADWQLSFALGNTVKYISRAGRKGDALEDLRKAAYYLKFEIARLENKP